MLQEVEDDEMTSQEVMVANSNSKELLKQPFLLESSISVAEYLQSQQMRVDSFLRLQVAQELPESWWINFVRIMDVGGI